MSKKKVKRGRNDVAWSLVDDYDDELPTLEIDPDGALRSWAEAHDALVDALMGVVAEAETRLEDAQDWEQEAKEGLAMVEDMDEQGFLAAYGPEPHQTDQRSTVAQPDAQATAKDASACEATDLIRELMAMGSGTVTPAYYNIYIWRGIEPELRGPYGDPEKQSEAALRTWDDGTANREDDGIFKLMIGPDGKPQVLPYAYTELDARLDAEAVAAPAKEEGIPMSRKELEAKLTTATAEDERLAIRTLQFLHDQGVRLPEIYEEKGIGYLLHNAPEEIVNYLGEMLDEEVHEAICEAEATFKDILVSVLESMIGDEATKQGVRQYDGQTAEGRMP